MDSFSIQLVGSHLSCWTRRYHSDCLCWEVFDRPACESHCDLSFCHSYLESKDLVSGLLVDILKLRHDALKVRDVILTPCPSRVHQLSKKQHCVPSVDLLQILDVVSAFLFNRNCSFAQRE
jgi:hypothetical protein